MTFTYDCYTMAARGRAKARRTAAIRLDNDNKNHAFQAERGR